MSDPTATPLSAAEAERMLRPISRLDNGTAIVSQRDLDKVRAWLLDAARQPVVDGVLDAAWRAAESALMPGEYLAGFSRYDDGLPWAATARTSGEGKRHNIVTGPFDYHGLCVEFGDTPADALHALAARLGASDDHS